MKLQTKNDKRTLSRGLILALVQFYLTLCVALYWWHILVFVWIAIGLGLLVGFWRSYKNYPTIRKQLLTPILMIAVIGFIGIWTPLRKGASGMLPFYLGAFIYSLYFTHRTIQQFPDNLFQLHSSRIS